MDTTTRRLFIVVLLLVVGAGIAFTLLGGGSDAGRPSGPSVDGVVIKVDSTGLASVSGFTLRTDDGRLLAFTLGKLRNGTVFAPGHLAEHQATLQRIRVWYQEAGGGVLDALWLEDAPAR